MQLVLVWRSFTTGYAVRGFVHMLSAPRFTVIGGVVLPGIEPSRYQEWADLLGQLIYVKPGHKLRLELDELQLDWLPLWRRCQREIWPSQRVVDSR